MFIDGPFRHSDDELEGIGCLFDDFAFLDDYSADSFPCPGHLHRPLGKHFVAPGDGVILPGIPFDDVMRLFRVFQGNQGLNDIVACISANQEWLVAQIPGTSNHPLDEVNKPFLAMLASGPPISRHQPSLPR